MGSKIRTHYPEHISLEKVDNGYLAALSFTSFAPASNDSAGPEVHTLYLDRVDASVLRDQLNAVLEDS